MDIFTLICDYSGGWDKINGGNCTHAWSLLTGNRQQYFIERDNGIGKFNDDDRRFLYAPWGPKETPWDATTVVLDDSWKHYYDDENTYNKVLETKLRFDPDHIFTANPFCVGYTKMPKELKELRTLGTRPKRKLLMAAAEKKTVEKYGVNDHSIYDKSKLKLDSSVVDDSYLEDLKKLLVDENGEAA